MSTRTCPSCQHACTDDSHRHCPQCGTRLPDPTPDSTAQRPRPKKGSFHDKLWKAFAGDVFPEGDEK
jgi:hypothetical protein